MKGRRKSSSTHVPDRRRLDTRARVVTQEEYIQLIEKRNEAKEKGNKGKKPATKTKQKGKGKKGASKKTNKIR